ncbi:MAG: UvrB/UvrC motif-containing protein, partial [Rhodocyclaceae bacterium]
LRSTRSLIQTIGRAARHIHGTAILYADRVTDSMKKAIGETARRRDKQLTFNADHGITPKTVSKRIKDIIDGIYDASNYGAAHHAAQERARYDTLSAKELAREIKRLEKEMQEAARNLEFERAATARDELFRMRGQAFGADGHDGLAKA